MAFITSLNLNSLLFISIIAALVALILILWIIRLEMKLKKLLIGSGAKNLADSLTSITLDLKNLNTFKTELEEYLKNVEKRLRRSVQGVSTLRFNPFKGTGAGGNQSFATAFLNEEGDGVVVSSLYSREHVSIFSKALKNFKSEFELTKEEQEAISQAKSQTKNK